MMNGEKMESFDIVEIASEHILFHREIKAHSVILAGASSFFEKLFLGPWSEKEKKVDSAIVVDMTEISFEVLKMLVNFIYTEEMEFTEKCPVRSAILAADYLMMDDAILKLTEHVIKNIEDETVCEIYEVSDRLFGEAKKELWFYLRNRLENDKIKVSILSMSLKCFQTLIQDDDRREINIKTALQTITSWVQHKRSHRARHALSLLKTAAYPMVGLRAMTVSDYD